MRFVRRADGSGSHFVEGWVGTMIRTNCQLLVDMGSESVVVMEQLVAPDDLCSECSIIETQNAYIAGASR